MGKKQNEPAISRREFARRVAMVSAAASLTPANLLGSELSSPPPLPLQPAGGPKLSPESQIEVDSRVQSILAQYGSRLSEAQKTDMRRLANEAQAPLDRLRAYVVENGDGPALYLKPLIEREKKPAQDSAIPRTGTALKNS
jgi:hypothetical protein